MGNWRTVYIVGTCPKDQVKGLNDALYCGKDYENFGPLGWTDNNGLCGLNKWVTEKIMKVGNLAERDYGVGQVAEHLTKVVQLSGATGLSIKIHCGDEQESDKCVATIICLSGVVRSGKPEIDIIPDIPEDQIKANFYDVIYGKSP